jgi:hypothetical protein
MGVRLELGLQNGKGLWVWGSRIRGADGARTGVLEIAVAGCHTSPPLVVYLTVDHGGVC